MTKAALSIADWVPSPAIDHVSSSPRYHPGRSDFPSPVGDLGYCLRSSLPCDAEAQVLAHIHPLHHRFTPPLDITTILEFVGSKSLSKIENDIHQAPRAPLPSSGVTRRGVTSNVTWKGVTPPSSLILAHAPDQIPPTGSSSLCRWVFAGCCQSLLEDGPSRRYL